MDKQTSHNDRQKEKNVVVTWPTLKQGLTLAFFFFFFMKKKKL